MFLSSACVAETTLQKGYENGITTGDTYTGAGYNVRCVKEEVGELTPSGNGPRCVLIGNSITRTWNTYDPDFFTANNLLAKGIDGQTSAQILERFFSDVVVNEPLCVQIECGTNDIADNDGAATVAAVMVHSTAEGETPEPEPDPDGPEQEFPGGEANPLDPPSSGIEEPFPGGSAGELP